MPGLPVGGGAAAVVVESQSECCIPGIVFAIHLDRAGSQKGADVRYGKPGLS